MHSPTLHASLSMNQTDTPVEKQLYLPWRAKKHRSRGEKDERRKRIPCSSVPLLKLIDPISYLDMLVLEKNAKVILTDSGGVQKEVFFFKIPCVTLREETEWVETVESGWNVLVGSDASKITHAALESCPKGKFVCPYGDGRSSKLIVELLSLSSLCSTKQTRETK